jgi:hypothetical protein
MRLVTLGQCRSKARLTGLRERKDPPVGEDILPREEVTGYVTVHFEWKRVQRDLGALSIFLSVRGKLT